MRKGRGLVDMDIYDELMKVPGARKLLIENTTNHRTDPRTKRLRAEIHEDAWQEVKAMVANWKRLKAGKPQQKPKRIATTRAKRPVAKKSSRKRENVDTEKQKRIKKLRNLKPGDKIVYKNVGFGFTTYENYDSVTEIKDGKLFTGNFDSMGMEWTGETWSFDGGLGMVTSVVLREDVPEGAEVAE